MLHKILLHSSFHIVLAYICLWIIFLYVNNCLQLWPKYFNNFILSYFLFSYVAVFAFTYSMGWKWILFKKHFNFDHGDDVSPHVMAFSSKSRCSLVCCKSSEKRSFWLQFRFWMKLWNTSFSHTYFVMKKSFTVSLFMFVISGIIMLPSGWSLQMILFIVVIFLLSGEV